MKKKNKKNNFKNYIKIILTFVIILAMLISLVIPAFAEENTYTFDNIPNFTEEEFNNAPVRLTIFGSVWCPFCQQLKQDLPQRIYKKYTKEQVAIKVYDIDKKETQEIFEKMMNNANIPDNLKGLMPSIFINEKYNYIGYHPKEIGDKIMADIEALLKNQKVIYGGNIKEIKKNGKIRYKKRNR